MGLFGKSAETLPCKVWRTRAEQLKGMTTEAMRAVTSGSDAAIVTFFDNRLEECRSFLQRIGLPYIDTSATSSGGGPSIYLLTAEKAESYATGSLRNPALLFNGLYPLPGREERIASNFSNAKSKSCYASLDDPLFKAFGMENVATLMETLGMKDGDCIEHKFVDKAINSAQEKLGSKVRNELPSNSEEDWFKKNFSK